MATVTDFVRESNYIEGIYRDPTVQEVAATDAFVLGDAPTLESICALQKVFAPGKPLRDRVGMNVRVGNHIAPGGGRNITIELMDIAAKLAKARTGIYDNPWKIHCRFETLHPFMDGNGRTGRALWAWHMQRLDLRPFALPFLHRWYYQTLENSEDREPTR